MKSFKNFLAEDYEMPLAHITPDGAHEEFVTKNLKNKETLDGINVQLLRATFGQFSNPYQPLNSISKLLATYGIQIPRAYFPAVDGGELIWSVASTGQLHDYNPSIPGANITPSGYYVYFEYETDDTGAYIAYAEVVDESGLDGLLEDLNEGMRLLHTHSNGEHTAKVYKDSEWGEHRVKFFKNGIHQKNADYHTDDLKDAHGTAKQQIGLKNESLSKDASASDYVDDFVHSKNKKFKGDSKKERIKRALGAYYSKKEDVSEETLTELSKRTLGSYIVKASKSATAASAAGEKAYNDLGKRGLRGKWDQAKKSKAGKTLLKANRTGENREKGIERATRRLTKEDSDLSEAYYGRANGGYRSPSGTRGSHTSNDSPAMKKALEAIANIGKDKSKFTPKHDPEFEAFKKRHDERRAKETAND